MTADLPPFVRALLQEIADRLEHFAATGEGHIIDLRALPMTDGDRAAVEGALGRGEVSATLDVAGRSEATETRYSAVWLVRHFGGDGRVAAERIEIAAIPEILMADRADAAAAARRLDAELGAAPPAKEVAEHV